jgi:cytochrome c
MDRDMFDTMTFTKILGSFAGALLIFLLGGWVAEIIYHSGGHGDQAQGYLLEVADSDAEPEEAEEAVPFEEVYASADASAGEGLFRACSACHALEDGANGVGPHLYGVVDREVSAVAGFNYSGALEEAADAWTPENISAFIEDPRTYAPGTSMGYNGMRDVQDRADLIAYLETIGS